jgi:hypothetical protein
VPIFTLHTVLKIIVWQSCAHCNLAVLCASPGEGVVASSKVYCFYLSGLDSLISFGYFFLGALAFLGYWFANRILLSVKVKVLGGGFDLWLGDNSDIVYG